MTADNQVGWVKADTKAIQAIHTTVVTHNPRVSVEHVGSSQWKLIIKSVRKEDAGFYMAQISKFYIYINTIIHTSVFLMIIMIITDTDPMKSQVLMILIRRKDTRDII